MTVPVTIVVALIASMLGPAIDSPLRVMTYNIRYDEPGDGVNAWPNRRDRVAGLIRFHDPDVIGLQEALAHQIEYLHDELVGYEWFGVGRNDGARAGEFSPIFYRRDRLELLDGGTFWLSDDPDSVGSVGWDAALTRIATWVRLAESDSEVELVVINTHFDHIGQLARLESARLLRRRAAALARGAEVVLMGDFNATPESEPYAALTSDPRAKEDALVDLAEASVNGHYGPRETWASFAVGDDGVSRIDYIFGSPTLRVLRYAVLSDQLHGRYPSDHLPVLVDITLSPN